MTNTEYQNENLNPTGNYTYIGIDIDTTGRRILDEIVHIAAYNPTEQYDQYVIPVMNLNPAARQRHHLRVITVGFFRMLKCTATNKVLKCKTEVIALKSFLDWLDERKKADTESDGIILIYHEPIKFIPFMLLEAFKKYDLLERFAKLVTGFVDGHALIETKMSLNHDTVKSGGPTTITTTTTSTLRDLAKLHLIDETDDEVRNFEGNAMLRARWAYKLVHHLAKDKNDDETDEDGEIEKDGQTEKDGKITTDLIEGYVHSVNVDINELTDQNKCIDLQHSFRPIFVQYFKTNLYHRYKAVTYRRVLAEKGYDLKTLEDVWTEKKKDGLTEIISKLDEIKEEGRDELVDILDNYFDPEKEQIVPVSKKQNRRHRSSKRGGNGNGNGINKENRRSLNGGKNGKASQRAGLFTVETNNNDELEPQTPDSSTTSPQRRHRRFRKRGTNNNRQLTPIKKSESTGNTAASNTVGATDITKVKTVETKQLSYITVA